MKSSARQGTSDEHFGNDGAAITPEVASKPPSRDIAEQCPDGQWMRCLKAFGERMMARDPDRQTAEIHIRIALMNRFSALGTAEIVRVD